MSNGAKTEAERLAELIVAIRELEAAADRVEKSGAMRTYPEQARAMAREHRAEARVLWRKGVRPLAEVPLESKKSPSEER